MTANSMDQSLLLKSLNYYFMTKLLKSLGWNSRATTSSVPASLGNLSVLERLDLSPNRLTGNIPQVLTNLRSIGVLNLSHNQLKGPIPKGHQFDTFSRDSYTGNLALCGPPLPKSAQQWRNCTTTKLSVQRRRRFRVLKWVVQLESHIVRVWFWTGSRACCSISFVLCRESLNGM